MVSPTGKLPEKLQGSQVSQAAPGDQEILLRVKIRTMAQDLAQLKGVGGEEKIATFELRPHGTRLAAGVAAAPTGVAEERPALPGEIIAPLPVERPRRKFAQKPEEGPAPRFPKPPSPFEIPPWAVPSGEAEPALPEIQPEINIELTPSVIGAALGGLAKPPQAEGAFPPSEPLVKEPVSPIVSAKAPALEEEKPAPSVFRKEEDKEEAKKEPRRVTMAPIQVIMQPVVSAAPAPSVERAPVVPHVAGITPPSPVSFPAPLPIQVPVPPTGYMPSPPAIQMPEAYMPQISEIAPTAPVAPLIVPIAAAPVPAPPSAPAEVAVPVKAEIPKKAEAPKVAVLEKPIEEVKERKEEPPLRIIEVTEAARPTAKPFEVPRAEIERITVSAPAPPKPPIETVKLAEGPPAPVPSKIQIIEIKKEEVPAGKKEEVPVEKKEVPPPVVPVVKLEKIEIVEKKVAPSFVEGAAPPRIVEVEKEKVVVPSVVVPKDVISPPSPPPVVPVMVPVPVPVPKVEVPAILKTFAPAPLARKIIPPPIPPKPRLEPKPVLAAAEIPVAKKIPLAPTVPPQPPKLEEATVVSKPKTPPVVEIKKEEKPVAARTQEIAKPMSPPSPVPEKPVAAPIPPERRIPHVPLPQEGIKPQAAQIPKPMLEVRRPTGVFQFRKPEIKPRPAVPLPKITIKPVGVSPLGKAKPTPAVPRFAKPPQLRARRMFIAASFLRSATWLLLLLLVGVGAWGGYTFLKNRVVPEGPLQPQPPVATATPLIIPKPPAITPGPPPQPPIIPPRPSPTTTVITPPPPITPPRPTPPPPISPVSPPQAFIQYEQILPLEVKIVETKSTQVKDFREALVKASKRREPPGSLYEVVPVNERRKVPFQAISELLITPRFAEREIRNALSAALGQNYALVFYYSPTRTHVGLVVEVSNESFARTFMQTWERQGLEKDAQSFLLSGTLGKPKTKTFQDGQYRNVSYRAMEYDNGYMAAFTLEKRYLVLSTSKQGFEKIMNHIIAQR